MSFKIDDEVIINPQLDSAGRFTGVVWRIVKAPERRNEVNYVLTDVSDPTRRLRTRGDNLVRRDEMPITTEHCDGVTTLPLLPTLHPGTVVRYEGKDGLFVVIANGSRPNTYRLFPLGGSDRYWRNVPQSMLTVIDVSRIKIDN